MSATTGATITTELTDRYIWAVVRSLPEDQRDEVGRELRASIEDAIETRLDAGETPKQAEIDALQQLGDPSRLAGQYADRPAWLVGPKYYYDWLRLLKILFAIVLPITVLALFIIGFISGGVGRAFGSAFGTGISVAVHLAFWPTLLFALIERYGKGNEIPNWTVDFLPQLPDDRKRAGRMSQTGECIASIVFLGLFAAALIWQQFNSVFEDAAGNPIPLLDPALWEFWLPYLFVIIALEVVFAVALFAVRGWNWPLAIVNIPLALAGAIPMVWLFVTHQVWNPAFVEHVGWGSNFVELADYITAAVVAIVALADMGDGILKAARAKRRVATA
jgi:hypothetical protein